MIARVYQDGKYIESVKCLSYVVGNHGTVLYKEMDFRTEAAVIPNTMMVIFDDTGEPDYLKMSKDLKEKQG